MELSFLFVLYHERSVVTGENEEGKCSKFSNIRIQPSENESYLILSLVSY